MSAIYLENFSTEFDYIFKEECLCVRDNSISNWRGYGFCRGSWIICSVVPLATPSLINYILVRLITECCLIDRCSYQLIETYIQLLLSSFLLCGQLDCTPWVKNMSPSFCPYLWQTLADFKIFFIDTLCGKLARDYLTSYHTLTASLQCLVKYKFSAVTIIRINMYVKTYLLEQFSNTYKLHVDYIKF